MAKKRARNKKSKLQRAWEKFIRKCSGRDCQIGIDWEARKKVNWKRGRI